jgi:hypothetical protein
LRGSFRLAFGAVCRPSCVKHQDIAAAQVAQQRSMAMADTRGRMYHATATFWNLLGSDWKEDNTDTIA